MCHLPAEWKSADSSACRSHSRSGAIAASSLRTSSENDILEREQAALVLDPTRAITPDPVGGDNSVAWNDERKAIPGTDGASRPLRVRIAGQGGQLPISHDFAPRDLSKRLDDRALKGREAVQIELDVPERVALTLEVRGDSVGKTVM
jgi:hypothetical protein